MRRSFPEIVSIGYEGRDVEALIRQLQSLRVDVLVDVRLNPISRKRGMSKVALREALEAHGIRYVHHRELGNPKDNRDGYRSGDHAAYRRLCRRWCWFPMIRWTSLVALSSILS